jgi:DNA-binding SARP family transcriptional activator
MVTLRDDKPLAVCLLGQPQFFHFGRPFRFAASRRALALTCYLILKRRAPVSRGAVTLAIWPDDDDATARAALRRELHRAVKALPEAGPEPWILADQTELCWNEAAGVWLDIDDFERLVAEGNPVGVRSAVTLYRGDLLDGLEDEWIFADRERLRAANAAALGRLLAGARSTHEYETAIGYAGRILTEDPFREDVVRTLISLRYESGDRAGALHEAERYAKLYREELGVGLMPETEALRFSISRGEPSGSENEPAGGSGEREQRMAGFTPAFVGRSKELQTAVGLWHRAMRGVGTTLFVSGEAGIGKSRLVEELALVAERQGGRVLAGHTSAPERLPYEAISTALGNAVPLLTSVHADPATRRSLERLLPGLSPLPAPRPTATRSSDVEHEQTRLFASLAHYVSALARTRPLLLVLEDVHWARPSTLAALQALAGAAAKSRVLIVATLREESIGEAHANVRRELVASELASALPLARLSTEDARAIVRSMPRAQAFDDATVEELARFSEGNAFYLIEGMVGFAGAGGKLPRESDAVADMINARVERMDEAVVDVASVAANIGERFTLDVLRSVCGLDEATLLDGIGQLIDEHFLAETTGRTSFDYTFRHHLIRNAIYERIPADKRRRRHRRIARVLEQHYSGAGGAAIDIARHFDAANSAAEAARWYRTAADFALRSYANEEAAALLEHSLKLATEPSERFETLVARQSLRARLGDAQGEAEDLAAMAGYAADLDENARLRLLECRAERALRARDVVEAESAVEALSNHPLVREQRGIGLAIARTRLGMLADRRDEAIADARAGLALVDARTPAVETVELLCHLAQMLFHGGEAGEGSELLARAMELGSSEDGNASLIARTNYAAAQKAYALAKFEESERYATASLEAAKIVGDRDAISEALASRSIARRGLRRLAEARADIDAAVDIGRSLARRTSLARMMLYSCMIDADSGELSRAADLCDAVIALDRSIVPLALIADAYNAKAFCRGLEGDFLEARELARASHEMFATVGNRIHEGYALNNLGALEREVGNVAVGLEYINRALEIFTPIFPAGDLASTRSEQALAYALLGEPERAREIAEDLLALPVSAAGFAWQHMMFLMLWRALCITQDQPAALVALERACQGLALHYAAVPEDSRERFLAIPFHRDLLAAAERAGIEHSIPVPVRAR